MSKIEDLIKRLCPNGVEYKKLVSVANVQYGFPFDSTLFTEDNAYIPLIRIRDVKPAKAGTFYKGEYSDLYIVKKGDILVGMDGNFNLEKWNDRDGLLNQRVCKIFTKNSSIILDNYLYHLLSPIFKEIEEGIKGGTVKHLSVSVINKIDIPVPPIDIQQEIVRILDNFTNLTAELQGKLQAELQARKEQYEYYRDAFYGGTLDNMLANVEKGKIKAKKLSELGTFVRGKRFVRADAVEEGYPCIHYGDMYTYYGVKADKTKTFIKEEKAAKLRFAEKGDVVIVGAGENKEDIGVGLAWLGEDAPAVHDACFIYKHSDELNPMYISYFLRTRVYHMQIHKHVVEAKICSLASDKIGTALIPIPPIEEQERIVSILDKFEALVNDLSTGLPAEIAALQEQYEYYRNKLLTFERMA